MKTKLVIFGITGDLSKKKLLPALSNILEAGEFEDLSIVGVSRRETEITELLEGFESLIPITTMFQVDLADISDYRRLKDYLDVQPDEQLLVYLSVPPSSATQIVDFMGRVGMNESNVKILFEKPFGLDLASAKEMIEKTAKYYDEDQIYRIDHYMAKEVANKIMSLRSDAANHHHAWGKHNVRRVEIVATETIGVEDRAVFYEQTGALRDVLQGHLMQLLSLVLLRIPQDFSMAELPDYRLKAMLELKTADVKKSKRAQYEGYQEEVSNVGSLVETYAEVELESADPNWRGVPLVLITGKKLDSKKIQIKVEYKDGSAGILDEAMLSEGKKLVDAYERVIVDAAHSRKSIFTSGEEVVASWAVLQPVLEAWAMEKSIALYKPGSSVNDVLKR